MEPSGYYASDLNGGCDTSLVVIEAADSVIDVVVGGLRVPVLPRLRGPALRGARRLQSITLLE